MEEALDELPSTGTRKNPPDPQWGRVVGLSHAFPSAIADLVDNSIDASAERVLVRLVVRAGLVSQILVVDNGIGMDGDAIDTAMRFGVPNTDPKTTLGHFGVGLKAASFSQANVLTVLSAHAKSQAEGRRLHRTNLGESAVLEAKRVEAAMDEAWNDFKTPTGTVVRWDDIRTFPKSTDPGVTDEFIESKVAELRHHLGLVFHRYLERRLVRIEVDVFDADLGESGFPFALEPIDPFGYTRSADRRYPKTFIARYDDTVVSLRAHIWPSGSDSHFFVLAGGPVDRFQGFYVYRNNRLLSSGGWNGIVREHRRLRLARVSIDIEDHFDAFTMNAENPAVHLDADLVHGIEQATADDGTTFEEYLDRAREIFRDSNRPVYKRKPILPPGQGISPKVKRVLRREMPLVEGEEPVGIRWTRLPEGEFVEVDREQRILWINNAYRESILRGYHGGVNDAPLIKTLLYLLYEDIFRGINMGIKDKDEVAFWGEVLSAAAEAEWKNWHG